MYRTQSSSCSAWPSLGHSNCKTQIMKKKKLLLAVAGRDSQTQNFRSLFLFRCEQQLNLINLFLNHAIILFFERVVLPIGTGDLETCWLANWLILHRGCRCCMAFKRSGSIAVSEKNQNLDILRRWLFGFVESWLTTAYGATLYSFWRWFVKQNKKEGEGSRS